MITKKDLIREIKRQHRAHPNYFSFLGWIENKDINTEVESYFCFHRENGLIAGYDWVNGNDKLQGLIQEVLK